MYRIIILVFSVLIILSIVSGCSDRGVTSVSEKYPSGEIWNVRSQIFPEQLGNSMFQSISKNPKVIFKVYIPDSTVSGYGQQGQGKPLPVLYMLSPFKEDESFYFSHGLQDVADRMIAAKEIRPMMIVCVGGVNGFGGSFYGNSEAGGKYAELIGKKTGNNNLQLSMTLIDYVDAVFNTIPTRDLRAISGAEMGGYGAMRIAMEYSENFSSVSSVSAPLDFDGASGDSGFIPLFRQVVDELDTSYRYMDTSNGHPLQTIFIAASTSFSPHDTGVVDVGINGDGKITDMTTYFHPFSSIEYHLPFDSAGEVYQPIWNLWLANNPPNMLTTKYAHSLDSTAILLMAHPEALYGYYQQTADFHTYLSGQGVDHTYLEFRGDPDFPATAHRFIYDVLPKILKFHSDNFVVPE